jgi:hypothetical protein
MSKTATRRKATQSMTVRAVLAQYLTGLQLESAIAALQDAMRHGPQAWAFKPKSEQPQPEEIQP